MMLFNQIHRDLNTIIAVGRGIGRRRNKRCIGIIVKECTECDALADHVIGSEVDAQGASATGRLRLVGHNRAHTILIYSSPLANQRRIALQLHAKGELEVIVHVLLLGLEPEHLIEIGNLIVGGNR